MNKKINKGIARGTIFAKPSKSYAHRLLIAAYLCNTEIEVKNIILNNDILATLNCLKVIGANINIKDNNAYFTKKAKVKENIYLDCFESGSTLRFLIPIVIVLGLKVVFTGTNKLFSRGLSVYEDIFKQDDINYNLNENSLSINGTLKGGKYYVKGNISSQFITGLLFALPLLKNDSIIELTTPLESKNYVDITLDVLNQFGIDIDVLDNGFFIKGNQQYVGKNSVVEGDYSNASFFQALNYLGGSIVINGLNPYSLQGDSLYLKYFNVIEAGYSKIDISNCIDLGPILFTMAAYFNGAHFIGTSRLSIKESDRVNDILVELEKFGLKYQILENEVIIEKSILHKPSVKLHSHNDHRLVMALSILLTAFGGIIENVEAVNKSYPDFFEDLLSLGIEVEDCE